MFRYKLSRIIFTNQGILQLSTMDAIDSMLSGNTKDRIEKGNLDLKVYAKIFKKALLDQTKDFDSSVNAMLDDANFVIALL